METFLAWDQDLLLFINGLHKPAGDQFFKFITWKFTWIPLYLFLLILLIRKEGKKCWITILGIIVLITITDQMASAIFKPWIARLRPCHVPGLQEFLHLVDNYCGGKYGFYSSHAANTTALTVFWSFRTGRTIFILLCIYTFLNCFSRIYLGVHFPTDILAGIFFGGISALVIRKAEQRISFVL